MARSSGFCGIWWMTKWLETASNPAAGLAEKLMENWVQVFSLAEVQPKMEGHRVSKSKPKVQWHSGTYSRLNCNLNF